MPLNQNPFLESMKLVSETMNKSFTMPNMGNISELQKRTSASVAEATQATTQTGQALWELQVSGFQNNLSEMFKLMKEMSVSPNLESNLTKQANCAKNLFENNLSNAREMAEIIAKSSLEVFDMFSRNAVDNIEKTQHAMPTTKKKASSNA